MSESKFFMTPFHLFGASYDLTKDDSLDCLRVELNERRHTRALQVRPSCIVMNGNDLGIIFRYTNVVNRNKQNLPRELGQKEVKSVLDEMRRHVENFVKDCVGSRKSTIRIVLKSPKLKGPRVFGYNAGQERPDQFDEIPYEEYIFEKLMRQRRVAY